MTYPDDGPPREELILGALRSNLQAIYPTSPTGPYHHTMAAVLVEQMDQIPEGMQFPVAVISLDGPVDSDTRYSCGDVENVMGLTIFGAITADIGDRESSRQEIGWLQSDIIRALDQDVQLGGLVVYCEPVAHAFHVSLDETLYWTEVRLKTVYRHAIGDPAAV